MDIKVIKLKIRRGTNEQRKRVIFDEGELGYTIDTQRLYVGTGLISGGLPAGSRIHQPVVNYHSITGLNAEIGDIVNANNLMYQLTGGNGSSPTNWQNISPVLNSNFFFYEPQDSAISLKTNSVSAEYLNFSTLSSSSIFFDSDNHNRLSIMPQGIDYTHISPITLSGGLQGGGTSAISLKIDTETFFIDSENNLSTNMQAVYGTVIGSDFEVSLFNGDPRTSTPELDPGISQTTIRGLSTGPSGVDVILLTSAGFLTFLGDKPVISNSNIKPIRYAIPIFTW